MRIILSIFLGIFLVGCNDAPVQEQKMPVESAQKSAQTHVVEKQPTGIKNTIAPVRIVSGKSLYAKCSGCHGIDASKKALGKSEVIKGWSVKKLTQALSGYQNGTYGRDMKAVMQGQVKELNAVDIHILSEYISKL